MSEGQRTADLHGLDERYEVLGELRGNGAVKTYIGRMKDPSAEVAILVARGGQNNDLSHLASDARMLVSLSHPGMIRVIDGCWLGTTGFAIVTDRVNGVSLGELLERGEKFSSPRMAAILEDVKEVLEWAREQGVIHRGVTPDTLIFEQGSDRVRLSLAPTPIPLGGVPDAATDARTIGMLAWAMYAGKPYGEGERVASLGDVCPNLATRVIDATNKMIAAKDHADAPDLATYIAIVAAADVLKQAEVEIAAMKEEYDEQHAQAIAACELKRQETEDHAQEQASLLAGEREEFARAMSDERAAIEAERSQMATERAELDRMMKERKDKLAAVRAELDQQRAELERRLTELEGYRKEVERVRKEAMDAAAANAAAASATPRVPNVPNVPPPPPHLKKPPKTDWEKFEAIDQDESDLVPTIDEGRPRWLIPSGIAALLLIVVAAVYGLTHRAPKSDLIKLGNHTVVPTAPAMNPGSAPRGGFLTQSAGGTVASKFSTTPAFTRVDSTAPVPAASLTTPVFDSTHTVVDSAARREAAQQAAEARRAAAARRAKERESAPTNDTFDPTNPTARYTPPPVQPQSQPQPRPDTVVRRDTTVRETPRDTATQRREPPRDTARVRPDTTRPRPDTLTSKY
jgi:hypothetical protein